MGRMAETKIRPSLQVKRQNLTFNDNQQQQYNQLAVKCQDGREVFSAFG